MMRLVVWSGLWTAVAVLAAGCTFRYEAAVVGLVKGRMQDVDGRPRLRDAEVLLAERDGAALHVPAVAVLTELRSDEWTTVEDPAGLTFLAGRADGDAARIVHAVLSLRNGTEEDLRLLLDAATLARSHARGSLAPPIAVVIQRAEGAHSAIAESMALDEARGLLTPPAGGGGSPFSRVVASHLSPGETELAIQPVDLAAGAECVIVLTFEVRRGGGRRMYLTLPVDAAGGRYGYTFTFEQTYEGRHGVYGW